jgi:hypothetical protein
MEDKAKIKFSNPIAQAVFDEAMGRIEKSEAEMRAAHRVSVTPSEREQILVAITTRRTTDFLAAAETAHRIEMAGYDDMRQNAVQVDGEGVVSPTFPDLEVKKDIRQLLDAIKTNDRLRLDRKARKIYFDLRAKYLKTT